MSIEAFGTRRVSESLRAIARYIDDAAKIARGVPPGQVVRLDLEAAPTTVSPRLTGVLWDLGDSETVPSIPLDELDLSDAVAVNVVVTGINLPEVGSTNRITLFKLVGQGAGYDVLSSHD